MEMRWTQPIIRAWASAAVGALIVAAMPLMSTAPAVASARPVAHAARTCSLAGKYRSLGPTYVEKLNVSRTSCGTGVKVIKSYNRCRLNAGGVKGRCHSKVLGFRCSETRYSGPVQFVATVRCTAGRAVVTFSYSENT